MLPESSYRITRIGVKIKQFLKPSKMENINYRSDLGIIKSWNKIAESFDKSRSETWEQCISYIESLPKDSKIIELGCGSGRHLIPCAEKFNFTHGLDISEKMLEITKRKLNEKNLNISLIQGNVATLPFKDNSFDSGLFIATLHHVHPKEKRLNTLIEVKRILKPGGTMLISVWNRYQERFLCYFILDFIKRIFIKREDEYGDIFVNWSNENMNIPRFHHLFSSNELEQLILESGLKIVTTSNAKIGSFILPDNQFILIIKDKE